MTSELPWRRRTSNYALLWPVAALVGLIHLNLHSTRSEHVLFSCWRTGLLSLSGPSSSSSFKADYKHRTTLFTCCSTVGT